jgi:hypothetical protein
LYGIGNFQRRVVIKQPDEALAWRHFLPTMAAAIELPGETNPLTPHNLFNALVSAASSSQQQLQIGTQQLQHWEKQDGYYPLLQVGSGAILYSIIR